MAVIVWHDGEVPSGMKVTQVYGHIFTKDGRMLLKVENSKASFAGGTPEKYDENRIATLRRELIEEVNTTIGEDVYMVGYQEIDEENGTEKYAQIRMVAMIDSIGEKLPDPDTGRTYDRLLVTPEQAIQLLKWGEVGEKQVKKACEIAKEKFGISRYRDFIEKV